MAQVYCVLVREGTHDCVQKMYAGGNPMGRRGLRKKLGVEGGW